MASEMTLEIITPEQVCFSGGVDEVTIPGTEGEFGVLKGHASLLSSVDVGRLSYTKDNKKTYYAVNTGYAEVTASKVTVLVETAERADLIDRERAQRARDAAEQKIKTLPREDVDFEKARLALLRAVTRLNVSGRH